MSDDPVTVEDDPTYSHFAHAAEFQAVLAQLLARDVTIEPSAQEDDQENKLVSQLGAILDYYLPQPGLLDPYISDIVPPCMEVVSDALNILTSDVPHKNISRTRLGRIGTVINWMVKARGWKAIIPYFPSTITYLPKIITMLSPPAMSSASTSALSDHHPTISGQHQWEIRVVLLLWLSLLLTVPFNLSALSERTGDNASRYFDRPALQRLFKQSTSDLAHQVTLLSIPLLSRPGKEGTFASLVLTRLFSRTDSIMGLDGFLDWAATELAEGERESEANFVASLFEMLAAMPALMPHEHLERLRTFTDNVLFPHLRGGRTAASSGLIRKLAVKTRGRWWMANLRHHQQHSGSDDQPDGLEEVLDDLMGSLSDKDTIVRYSSAKYLARLASLLPDSLKEQMVQATIGLFAGTEDEPVIETSYGIIVDSGGTTATEGTMGLGGQELTRGESRWHGCCLAVAEMARRGLITGDTIEEAVQYAIKALTFDLRKSSHSVGANVRDAAAYLIWSLSRACSPGSLQQYAEAMATRLVCVACLDREVGVRRAASAAFQEGVGRLGIYPEGIEVLGHTDFYSVSVRRMAFSVAVPAVGRHQIYRDALRKHLHEVTLRHWHVTMQVLGATSLRELLSMGDKTPIDDSQRIEIGHLSSLDSTSVRGALHALGQICQLLEGDDEHRLKIIAAIARIRPSIMNSARNAEILHSAADALTASLSSSCFDEAITRDVYARVRNDNMRKKEVECHQAAAGLIGKMSSLRPASEDVQLLAYSLSTGSSAQRQAAAMALGAIEYRCIRSLMPCTIDGLLRQLEPASKADVETRKASVTSVATVACQTGEDGNPLVDIKTFETVVNAMVEALSDYSTDQRGDVGSWVRAASIAALGRVIAFAAAQDNPQSLITQDLFDRVIGGMVKQGVEKLEPIRAEVWRSFTGLRAAHVPKIWSWEGSSQLAFPAKDTSDEAYRYIDIRDWYKSAMPLLDTKFRPCLVSGLVLAIGSPASAEMVIESLAEYLRGSPSDDILLAILADVQYILSSNFTSNRIFIPGLTTCSKILALDIGADLLESASRTVVVTSLSTILKTATRGLTSIKSVERILAVMMITVTLLATRNQKLFYDATGVVPMLLTHRFPRVRALTAEKLYLTLSESGEDLDEDLEELLLETDWSQASSLENEARQVTSGLSSIRAVTEPDR